MRKTRQGQACQPAGDLLASLDRVYGKQRIQRDLFGRRTALPSEIASLLANNRAILAAGTGEDGNDR